MVSVKHLDPCYSTSNDSKLPYDALEKELLDLVNAIIIHDDQERQQPAEGLFVALSRPSMKTARSTNYDVFLFENLGHKTAVIGRWITYNGS